MGKGTAKISNMRLPATPRPPKLVAEPTAEQLRRFVEDRIGHAMITGRDTTMEEENERLRRRRKPRPDSPERYVAAVRHKTSLADTPDSTLKRCKNCRRVAVRGLDVCYFHGGAHLVHQRRLERGDSVDGLNILFVARTHAERTAEALRAVRDRPVLTVTESDQGLANSAMVNFVIIDNKVRFDVSLVAAERGKLKISARLLGVARQVEGRPS